MKRAGSDSLTYAPAGVSMGGLVPPGLSRRHWTTPLEGANAFERAAEALRTWAMHRGAWLRIAADGPIAIGTNVAFSAPLPIGFIDGTCRIVVVVDEPNRYGFAYGTLSVHPERGEESFVVLPRRRRQRFVSTSTACRDRRIRSPGSRRRSPTTSKIAPSGATSPSMQTLTRGLDAAEASALHGRLRPRRSWLDTQSPWRIAPVRDVSPASTTAAQISANLSDLPLP